MDNGMTKIGVIFTRKVLTTKSGKEYYSGKTEDAGEDEFNLMAFRNVSKGGSEYLSIMKVEGNDKPRAKPKGKTVSGSEATDEEYWNEVLK